MADNECRPEHEVKLMNVQETAEFLRIAPKTVYGLVSRKMIPYRKAGRRLLFMYSELILWTLPTDRKRRLAPK